MAENIGKIPSIDTATSKVVEEYCLGPVNPGQIIGKPTGLSYAMIYTTLSNPTDSIIFTKILKNKIIAIRKRGIGNSLTLYTADIRSSNSNLSFTSSSLYSYDATDVRYNFDVSVTCYNDDIIIISSFVYIITCKIDFDNNIINVVSTQTVDHTFNDSWNQNKRLCDTVIINNRVFVISIDSSAYTYIDISAYDINANTGVLTKAFYKRLQFSAIFSGSEVTRYYNLSFRGASGDINNNLHLLFGYDKDKIYCIWVKISYSGDFVSTSSMKLISGANNVFDVGICKLDESINTITFTGTSERCIITYNANTGTITSKFSNTEVGFHITDILFENSTTFLVGIKQNTTIGIHHLVKANTNYGITEQILIFHNGYQSTATGIDTTQTLLTYDRVISGEPLVGSNGTYERGIIARYNVPNTSNAFSKIVEGITIDAIQNSGISKIQVAIP